MIQNVHHDSINHLLDMIPAESIHVLPAGVVSDDILSILETSLREKPNVKKQNKTHQGENSIKENNNRLNRSNFFFKNITTSMTYMDVFISTGTQHPLVQLNTTEISQKTKYLCVAGNVFST
ncbi:unnamed protein product [Rotaria magnacalcarata]|uniref:Uncharacterized protein n=1 Tax=Rotaria magnacalcarata TaxID=392030 RepID=A0A820DKU8_9BILA|nr:unnamed protein product [Rotaria magnacalcarata]CAF1588377.1 unnamed protein product [Rotaria magnacalcarata]CAF2027087.1 unnamed protein product [Rotaria magnacalcarata]CAF2095923.1 unnamed protein product [Rotaria magnacalcarata]CAF2238497.1 unnamed protein product [Rotaria magnacalcarata]